MSNIEESDSELIARYLEGGDEQALQLLVSRHLKSIYNFAYSVVGGKSEADDVTQEAFVKIWKNLKKFDGEKSFRTWAFSITRNAAIDYLRKRKAIPFSYFDDEKDGQFAESIKDEEAVADELFDLAYQEKEVAKAIDSLPNIYREIISLKLSEDMTFEEMAEIMGESVNTIKSRHRRGVLLLKKSLEPYMHQNYK
ncbi:MAG: sigma-70 family RNA polymerase sigma factor [bacterium]